MTKLIGTSLTEPWELKVLMRDGLNLYASSHLYILFLSGQWVLLQKVPSSYGFEIRGFILVFDVLSILIYDAHTSNSFRSIKLVDFSPILTLIPWRRFHFIL